MHAVLLESFASHHKRIARFVLFSNYLWLMLGLVLLILFKPFLVTIAQQFIQFMSFRAYVVYKLNHTILMDNKNNNNMCVCVLFKCTYRQIWECKMLRKMWSKSGALSAEIFRFGETSSCCVAIPPYSVLCLCVDSINCASALCSHSCPIVQ